MPRKRIKFSLSDMLFEPGRFVRDVASDNLMMLVSADDVRAAVDSLPDGQREVIQSRFGFSGYEQSFDTIGQRLGITKQAVQYREKAALAKLKRELERHF